eukprot:1833681-Rhodomonas_salina.1
MRRREEEAGKRVRQLHPLLKAGRYVTDDGKEAKSGGESVSDIASAAHSNGHDNGNSLYYCEWSGWIAWNAVEWEDGVR